jgi:hypothetical protein
MHRISLRIALILSVALLAAGCLEEDIPPSPNEPTPQEDSIPTQQSFAPGIDRLSRTAA